MSSTLAPPTPPADLSTAARTAVLDCLRILGAHKCLSTDERFIRAVHLRPEMTSGQALTYRKILARHTALLPADLLKAALFDKPDPPIPEVRRPRGRPCLGDEVLTAVERSRRRRAALPEAAAEAAWLDPHAGPDPARPWKGRMPDDGGRQRGAIGRAAKGGFLALLAVWMTPALAQPDAGVSTMEMRGTVGSSKIGVALTIRDYRTFIEGHYFYVRYLTDIPLTGSMRGEALELNEPGGGSFHLHLVSNASVAGQGLTFYNSIGLEGVWIKNGMMLPVRIRGDHETPGAGSAEFYPSLAADPNVYETRVRRCIRSVLEGDKNTAATLVSYPLRVNGSVSFLVRTRTELLKRWNQIFTPSVMKALRDAVPHEMFEHDGQIMIGNGDVWFNELGMVAINQNDALQQRWNRAASGASK